MSAKITSNAHSRLGLFQNALFCALILMWSGLFVRSLFALVELAFRSDPYSHTIVIPILSSAFIYWKRRAIFSRTRFDIVGAVPFFIATACFYWLGLSRAGALLDPLSVLSISILSCVSLFIGSFVLCYGFGAARAAAFPLLLLLLMIPFPKVAADIVISALQHWSADGVAILYDMCGVPVQREGLVFHLPGVSILVAEECSGIRTTLALFVTVLLAAQLALKSTWRKLTLCILVVPIAVAKNAIRIFTLSTLAVYVNKDFLYGRLHRNGGVLFFLLGLAVSIGFLELLGLWERSGQRRSIRTEDQSKDTIPQTSPVC